jgi:hypothetical protein
MTGAEHDHLRPVERRVLRWAEIGIDDAEIARRFGRSERWVAQVRFLAELDRSTGCGHSSAGCSAGGVQGSGTRISAAGSAAAPSSSRGSRTTPGTSWR